MVRERPGERFTGADIVHRVKQPHRRVTRLWFVGLAFVGAAVSAWFNHVVTDRLGSAGANDVRSVLAGLSAAGFLGIGLQLALVGWLGRYDRATARFTRHVGLMFAALAAAVALLVGLLAVLLIDATTNYRVLVGVLVAAAFGSTIVTVPARAELLQAERWVNLGVLTAAGPVVRVVIGLLVLSSDRSVLNVMPIAAGEMVVAGMALALRPHNADTTSSNPPIQLIAKSAVASTGLLLTLVFSSIALRSQLGQSADDFNAAGVLARSVLFLPLTVVILFFPAMARGRLGTPHLKRAYSAAQLWTAGLATLTAAVLAIAPGPISRVVLDTDEAPSATVVRVLALAWMMSAIAVVPLLLHIAHASRVSFAAWVGAIIVVAGQLAATSAVQLAAVAVVASAALLAAVLIPALIRIQPVVHARSAEPTPLRAAPRGDFALVIPCYNPGPAVVTTIEAAHDHLSNLGLQPHIIVVCDGSTDGSDRLVDAIDLPTLEHLRHPHNRGKGAAIRTGFAHSHSQYVAFIDADGDLSPHQLGALLSAQVTFDADIVFGSKLHPDSQIHASALRRVYSYGYQKLITILFQLDIRDTQTGIKLFRHDVVEAILPTLHEEQFALDLELFIAARAAGFTNFVEVPVVLRRESGSTISRRAVRRMLNDTLRLFWRAKIALQYTRYAALPVPAEVVDPFPSARPS